MAWMHMPIAEGLQRRSGRFSERSACYLGAARHVITQETGFGRTVLTGEGLFAFTTIDDILASVRGKTYKR